MASTSYIRSLSIAFLALGSLTHTGGSIAAEPSFRDLPTAVVRDGTLYAAAMLDEGRVGGRLVAVSLSGDQRSETFFLPVRAASPHAQYPFAWQMGDSRVFFISVLELTPGQHSFSLAGVSLEKLRRTTPPEGLSANTNAVGPELDDVLAQVWPVSTALIKASVKKTGPVYFDLGIADGGLFDVSILSDRHLEIWRGKINDWVLVASYDLTAEAPVDMLSDGQKQYVLTGAGRAYLIDGTALRELGRWADDSAKAFRYIAIQENQGVSLISIDDLLDPQNNAPRAFNVHGSGLSRREIPLELRSAARKALELLRAPR